MRAAIVMPASIPHNNPPAIRAMKGTSRRSSGVLMTVPANTATPIQTKTAAKTVSTKVTGGEITAFRVDRSASTPRPMLHQNRSPAKGQLISRHVSVIMPFGAHSLLAGLAMTYGSCVMSTGKFRAKGNRIRRSSIFVAQSAASCCSGVSIGISMLIAGPIVFFEWVGA